MRKQLLVPALAALVVAGCATAGTPEPAPDSEAPAVMDLAGSYTFTTTVQGMGVNGQMRITGAPGAYSGSAYSDVTGEIPLRSIAVEGNVATLIGDTPDGPVEIRMVFDGDTFTGGWSLAGDGGSIQGRRVGR